MSLRVRFDADRLRRHLEQTERDVQNLRPIMQGAGERMIRSINRNFDEQGRPVKWDPLAASTLLGKIGGRRRGFKKRARDFRVLLGSGPGTDLRAKARRKLSGNKILIDTGRLLRSIKYRATRRELIVGTNLVYAAAHQYGIGGRSSIKTRRYMGAIPARPFVLLQPADRRAIRRAFVAFVAHRFGSVSADWRRELLR